MSEFPQELTEPSIAVPVVGSPEDFQADPDAAAANLAVPEGIAAEDAGTTLTSGAEADGGFGELRADEPTGHQVPDPSGARQQVSEAFEEPALEAETDRDEPKDGSDSVVTQSELFIAQSALREAERLQALLDDSGSEIGDAERASMQGAVDRFRATADIHKANLPLARADELAEAEAASESERDPVVVPDLPFVDVHEQVGRKSDEDLVQEIENKDHLAEQANLVGDRIRLAAMDKAPTNIGRRPKEVNWETTDEERPGSAYRFSAIFEKEDDHPVLRAVSCSFISDRKAAQSRAARQTTFGQNIITHPVTVAASFDGPRLSELKLIWPNRSRIRSTAEQFGPAWRESVSGDREGMLSSLVREVEGSRGSSGPEGFVQMVFGDRPAIVSGVDTQRWGARDDDPSKYIKAARTVMSVNPAFWLLSRQSDLIIHGNRSSHYQYVPAQDKFVGEREDGTPSDLSVDEGLQLAGTIGQFFPVMKKA